MAQDRPEYEVVDEFNNWANQIVKKYPQVFYGVDVNRIRCVKITNKTRPEKREKMWELVAVKMPVLMDCIYSYYVVLYSSDWDALPENLQLLLIAEILHGLPKDDNSEGKVIPPDTKGYGTMFRTFKSIDYMEDSAAPHLLKENINWVTNKNDESQEQEVDNEDVPMNSETTISQEA